MRKEFSDLTPEQQRQIAALAAMTDDEIDMSDLPEVRDFSKAKRGVFYLGGGKSPLDNPDYWYLRGDAYLEKKGDYDQAIADFSRAIALNPDNAEYWHDRGAAHFRKGDYDRAIADYARACQLAPDNTEYRDNLRKAEGRKGRLS